jgi:hypothetical protein
MKNRVTRLALFLALMLPATLALSQQLTVQIESGKQTILSRSDIEALPHVTGNVPVNMNAGANTKPNANGNANINADTGAAATSATTSASISANYEGVPLRALLEKAGATFGETIRGKRLASYLLVEAADGYRVVIALPELDPAFTEKQVILAVLKDGKPLDAKEGPYRIMIPDEKRMARWVRQVSSLKIMEVP